MRVEKLFYNLYSTIFDFFFQLCLDLDSDNLIRFWVNFCHFEHRFPSITKSMTFSISKQTTVGVKGYFLKYLKPAEI